MSVEGLCQICQTDRADRQCTACGALVCDDHFDAEHGVCAECGTSDPPGSLRF